MDEASLLLGFITLQRLAELVLAARNTARLRVRGAIEFGQSHYPMMVTFHAAWLGGLWWFGFDRPVQPGFLALFIMLQGLRIWVLASLGARWTTRIIVLRGPPLVRRGPYRWLRHPNYVVVAMEIAIVPLALGLPLFAGLFSVLHIPLVLHRIAVESAALVWAEEQASPAAKTHP